MCFTDFPQDIFHAQRKDGNLCDFLSANIKDIGSARHCNTIIMHTLYNILFLVYLKFR